MIDWTEEKIQTVYNLMQTGITSRQASVILDIPSCALIGKMSREYGGWGTKYKTRIPKKPSQKDSLREAEDRILREMWPNPQFTIETIAKRLTRGTQTLRSRARYLGLRRPRKTTMKQVKQGQWTEEEIALLKKLWRDDSVSKDKMARVLGRGYKAVIEKARNLQLNTRKEDRREISVFKWPVTPWPEDMPSFEDHENTVTSRAGGRYVRGEL